ncbi:MAG: TlpA disulfide reductase family protein [Acetobacteraceae bacterium]|jgi:thiol-disulfide isomerase/thioredoxin
MHRPPRVDRRTALGLLAALPLGVNAHRTSAASPAELRTSAASPTEQGASITSPAERRQAEALAQAEFTDPQGAAHRLSELTRPLVLVNLWAAWCAGCLEELPTIRALASLLGPEAIDVVLLSHEMNWRGDQAYARKASLPFRHWRLAAQGPESITAAAFRVEADRFALPQTLVFAGRDRTLVRSQEGSQDWAAPDQVRLARAWLAAAG